MYELIYYNLSFVYNLEFIRILQLKEQSLQVVLTLDQNQQISKRSRYKMELIYMYIHIYILLYL